jgi:hypothetical protein
MEQNPVGTKSITSEAAPAFSDRLLRFEIAQTKLLSCIFVRWPARSRDQTRALLAIQVQETSRFCSLLLSTNLPPSAIVINSNIVSNSFIVLYTAIGGISNI